MRNCPSPLSYHRAHVVVTDIRIIIVDESDYGAELHLFLPARIFRTG